jgi:hypothetical protein
MLFRKGIVLPLIIGTFLVGAVYKGSIIAGFQAIFNANLVAAQQLFNIFLIISIMIALLNSLKDLGADKRMVIPIQKIMVNGHVSYLVLMVATYVISLFFWPTPAVPLICALLVPAAVSAGLPVMTAAMVIVIAGQGMALSSDYIMQVAPMISAKAAGIDKSLVADKAMILSLITGLSALAVVYVTHRKAISKKQGKQETAIFSVADELAATLAVEESPDVIQRKETWGKAFAVIVPLAMLGVMIYMFGTKIGGHTGFEGGDGAAFIGGVATILLVLATIAFNRIHALDKISEHITEGFVFAFKAMAPVIPIAGFFFMGTGDYSGQILSLPATAKAPAFLFDIIQSGQAYIPHNPIFAALGILLVGIITGLDGSGFAGLPLTGALSGALGHSSHIDPSVMAAIGQMGSVWSGGGTLIAWSSLCAVAGFLNVSPLELARKNFLPVIIGLLLAAILAVIIW